MNEPSVPSKLSGLFSQPQVETQAQLKQIKGKSSQLYIGLPKELNKHENRIALSPDSVRLIVGYGHRIVVETGAGDRSNFTDQEYSEAGAEIAYDAEEVYKAHILIKVSPPNMQELDRLHPDQMLISPLHLPIITVDFLNKLRQKRVIALAMEYLQDDDGSYPLVRIMSEMAGISSILTAAELLSKSSDGNGILLGGVSGVPPSKVVILGAGVVGESAARTAMGLGAEVRVFDNNIYKLMRLKSRLAQSMYTSSINLHYLKEELYQADVAIGAIHSKLGRTPMIVTEDMVTKMKPGSVIVDVSIDQGGCFETSEVTNHDNPTFIKHEVIHYCVPNIASKVPRTSSLAMSNILTPLLIKAGTSGTLTDLFFVHPGLRKGIYMYKGTLTNKYLGERYGMKSTDIDLLLTSRL
jgi:alanine dehydrogenase